MQYAGDVSAASRQVVFASLRASQWAHFSLLPLVGIERSRPVAWGALLLAWAAASGCLGYAYGLNAVVERGSDRSSAKNPLVARPSEAKAALVAAMLSAGGALLLGAGLGGWGLVCVAASLLSGTLYSVGLRAKRLPVAGLVFNAGIFVPLTLVLLSEPGGGPWVLEVALFCGLLTQNQLVHELADEEEDRAAGAFTTAQLLGRSAWRVAVVLVGCAGLWFVDVKAPLRASLALATCAICAAVAIVIEPAALARRTHRFAALLGGAALHAASWWAP